MKILILYIPLLMAILQLNAGAEDEHLSGIGKYRKMIVEPSFAVRFKSEEDKTNFRRLREYLGEQEQLKKELVRDLESISERYDEKEIFAWQEKIALIDSLMRNKRPIDNIELSPESYWNLFSRRYTKSLSGARRPDFASNTEKKIIPVTQLNERRAALTGRIEEIRQDSIAISNLRHNIDHVSADINECRNQIDAALMPVIKDQAFRKDISFAFVVLIGVLLVAFFASLFWKADGGLADDMLSSNGLQFITLFVLIIAIILFGILGILQGSELAAILSGISGYILGKGNQNRQSQGQHTDSRERPAVMERDIPEIANVRKPQAGAPIRE